MHGCSLLTADSELKLLLGYYVARLLDWMTFILDPSLHQLCNASLRNKALLYLTSVFSYNLDFTSGALQNLQFRPQERNLLLQIERRSYDYSMELQSLVAKFC